MKFYDRRSAPKRSETWFVYGLVDTRLPGRVRYIGLTNNPRARLNSHISTSRAKQEKSHKASWVQSVISSGSEIGLAILSEGISRDDAGEVEAAFVSTLRDTLVLTNTTDGGLGGMSGVSPGPETRAKISAFHKGRSRSKESRDRLSETSRILGPQKNNSCGYRGVHLDADRKKWVARIIVNGKRKKLGRFDTAESAAMAYDAAAFELWRHDCYLNFPDNFKEPSWLTS